MAVGMKVIHHCSYGCKIKLTEVLLDVVYEDGSMGVELDTDAYVLAINAHMRGMHA